MYENAGPCRNSYPNLPHATRMGITPDDVAYDLHNEEIENEERAIGQAVLDGDSMCSGCTSPLTWRAVERVFHCTTPGCEFQH